MISLNNVPPVSTRYLAVWVLRGDVPIWVEGMEAPACHRHAIRVFARSALSLVMLSWQLILSENRIYLATCLWSRAM